jgi:hypothetical protein
MMNYLNKREYLGELVVDHLEGVEVDQVADPEVALEKQRQRLERL